MKRVLFAAFVMLSAAGCGFAAPDAGTEAVLVRKPYFFGHGGIDATSIKAGRSVVAMSTDAVYVNMQPQRVDVAFDDLMTSDGVPIDFHAVLSYQVTDSVKLVRDFGADFNTNNPPIPGFFTRNLDQPFRTLVRDEVKRHGMNEMAIQATAAEQVDSVVTDHLLGIIKETGVPIRLIDLSLGRANPPDAILHQRVETAAQEQRINTEKQRKLAEDQRKAANESQAIADSAYNLKMNAEGGKNLTPDMYLRLEEINMKREVCAKGGCTFWFGEQPAPVVAAGKR